jgi:hypothetical protein
MHSKFNSNILMPSALVFSFSVQLLEVIFVLDESSLGLKLSLYPDFQIPMCLGTGLKVCGGGGGGC